MVYVRKNIKKKALKRRVGHLHFYRDLRPVKMRKAKE